MNYLDLFREIWLVDFEFCQPDGERATPVCMVAREFRSGRLARLWQDQLSEPPFSLGPESLFVAYYSSAEWGCHLALGWPMPARILDLYVEFRCLTSGLATPCGRGLLGALAYYGLDAIEAAEKDTMRQLVMRGGPWSDTERKAILNYCQSDVDSLARLLPVMLPSIDLPRAIIRGRYMAAAAKMEWTGVPIDGAALSQIRENWALIQEQLIHRIDKDYAVYDGRTFKADRWEAWVAGQGISWPRLESGKLALDDDTFREMARSHPAVTSIRELRTSLSQLRLNELAVGADHRNRCLLSAFGSRTGRNQPSNSKFVFGPATWLRGLIRPEPGMAIAYIDYEQQEFAIGAALSNDPAMTEAYRTGDPYLAFAKQAGAVPFGATKRTHEVERERFKVCALAVQYGMSAEGLAKKLDDSPARGRELLHLHRATYPQYWKWSDAIRDYAILHGALQAVFGWTVHVGGDVNPRSLRNFPLQANGGEMLRLACCFATERGLRVCCPVHDALLIEAPTAQIDGAVAECQRAMEDASKMVLSGFIVRTEAKIVHIPSDMKIVGEWRCGMQFQNSSEVSVDDVLGDFARFRLPNPQPIPQRKPTFKGKRTSSRPRVKGEFLKGPISLNWLSTAAKLPGKASLAVALAIMFEVGRRRSQEIVLTTAILHRFGMNRKGKYRGLQKLERAGLIAVVRSPRRNPVVTVLEVQDGKAGDLNGQGVPGSEEPPQKQ